MTVLADFEDHLTPVYLRRMPIRDGWNSVYLAETDALGDHYTVQSMGKDKTAVDCITGTETQNFDCDICHVDGMFTQWPEGIQRE